MFIVNGVEVDANGKPLAEKEQVSSTSGELDILKARVGTLEDERNTLTTELVNLKAQGVLPADARERLIKVKGISDVWLTRRWTPSRPSRNSPRAGKPWTPPSWRVSASLPVRTPGKRGCCWCLWKQTRRPCLIWP